MRKLYAILLSFLVVLTAKSQYTPLASPSNPGIVQSSGANYVQFRLTTTDPIEQAGAVWRNAQYNLGADFTLLASLYFGAYSETNQDMSKRVEYRTGADGIGLVLSTAQYLGDVGEEVGYGTTPQTGGVWAPNQSVAVEFDTWRNITCCFDGAEGWRSHNDPDGNHIAMMARGQTIHGVGQDLVSPISLANDLEDGAWHDVTIQWSFASRTLSVTSTSGFPFSISRSFTTTELNTIFGGTGVNVYLGFTAATGSAGNVHMVRFITPPSNCTAGRTYTIGGWGAEPKGQNPGTYLHSHFSGAFPSGLTVGNTSGDFNVHFTSAQAITDYLPAGGQSKALTKNYNNPATTDLKNTLVSQLIGVTLAVGMDNTYADFSPSDVKLGDMVINSGTFAGWTVNQFLAAANAALGGAASAYTLDQFNTTATAINENYDEGVKDNGVLRCPDNSIQRARMTPAGNATDNAIIESGVNVYPNPSRGQVQVNVGSARNAEIQIVNSRGIIVERRLAGGAQTLSLDLKKYGVGVYVVKMISGSTVKTSKVLVQN